MNRFLAVCTLGCLALAMACKSAPEPEPEPKPEPEAPAAEVVWSVPLTWQSNVPMVEARVRDGQTKLVVSTNSSYHTLTKAFASAVRAPVSTTRQTTTVHGATADVEKIEGVLSVKSADAEWRLEEVVAMQAERLDPQGIGGFIVPQRLASNTEHVVLDFRGRSMTLVSGKPELFVDWFERKYGGATTVGVSRDDDGRLYVEAKVAGRSGQKLLVDTGIARTRLAGALVGAEVADEACVEGADLAVECLPGVEAAVEALTFAESDLGPVRAIAVPEAPEGTVGSLGTDVLGNCVIGLGVGNQAYVSCGG